MEVHHVTPDVSEVRVGPHSLISVYVIDAPKPALIETGTAADVDELCRGLRECDVDPGTLHAAVVSHVHLDHSGGVAGLLDRAPELQVYHHRSTSHHLVDPDRLIESSKRALGDQFEAIGAPKPVPEEAIRPVTEGRSIDLGDRTLEVAPTPGHSPDHLSVWDPTSAVLFANEAIGRYYPADDTWLPPITLPQFDPDGVAESIDRLEQYPAEQLALSHVGSVRSLSAAFEQARDRLDAFMTEIPAWHAEGASLEELVKRVERELLDLEGYPRSVAGLQADICTRGVLQTAGLE